MSRDLRRYANQTNIRLLAGFFLLLIVVGGGLIYVIYGKEAALSGLVCILASAVPLLLVWLALTGLEWIVKRTRRD